MFELEEMDAEDTQHGKFLTFMLDEDVYGLEIKYVTEIVGIQPITPVPELPSYIKGIINLRGQIIPVVDVRLKFKKQPKEYDNRTCIIVVDILEVSVGLIVDNVAEVTDISDDNIVDPPSIKTGFNVRYIRGIGKSQNNQIKLLLDCNKLLTEQEYEQINTSMKNI